MSELKLKKLSPALSACIMVAMLVTGCTTGNGNTAGKPSPESTNTSTEQPKESETTKDQPQFSDLSIKVLGKAENQGKPSSEDVLGPIWYEKTKVKPEIVTVPTGTDISQWLQMNMVGNTLPDVLAINGILDHPQNYDLMRKNNALREIKFEELEANMPLFKKRLEKYGLSLKQLYEDNVGPDGKLWYVPGGLEPAASPYLRETPVSVNFGHNPYYVYVRDDILKKIYPQAKTEKELKDLIAKQNGELKYEDISDVPIKNRDDLYNFLKQVKALKMTENGKPIIPGHINNSSDVSSLMWSGLTLGGFWWQFGSYGWKEDQLVYVQGTDEWKEYIRWYNKLYNEDLIDKETFIQKDDQKVAKVTNGQYAVFQQWLPVADARKGKDYGYRLLPLFYDMPLETKFQSNQYLGTNLAGAFGGVAITKSAKEDNIPQILRWIDWNMSEEAADLRFWGPEGKFYTGSGKDRRFKPEYKGIEDWWLRGQASDKDATYYGLNQYNQETNLIWGFPDFGYPEAPYYVYPPRLTAESINVDATIINTIKAHYRENLIWFKKDPHLDFKYLDPNGDWSKLSPKNAWDSEKGKTAIARTIIGSQQDFEKNYAEYEKTFSSDWNKMNEEFAGRWEEIWSQYVKPEIDKAENQ